MARIVPGQIRGGITERWTNSKLWILMSRSLPLRFKTANVAQHRMGSIMYKFQNKIFNRTNRKTKCGATDGAPAQVTDVRTSTVNQTEQYRSCGGLCCLSRLEHLEGSANRRYDVSELNKRPLYRFPYATSGNPTGTGSSTAILITIQDTASAKS
jgi:hypothetical protein